MQFDILKTKFEKTRRVMLLLGACLVSACASNNDPYASEQISDPFEGTNRAVFKFNTAVDDAVIHPVIEGYRFVVPRPARTGIRNALRNLNTPTRFANQVLQGDVDGALTEVSRGMMNTLLGFGGFIDIAADTGLEHEAEDFGQTLAVWGVPHGPYLVVPLLGPSSLRDYAGYIVDGYADPLRHYLDNIDQEELYYTKVALSYLDLRESLMDVLKSLEYSSVDYYASVRSTYYQRRQALVNDEGKQQAGGYGLPDFDE